MNPDGPHLSFPFRIAPDGRTAQTASLEEHIRDEVLALVLTAPGERPFLAGFGGGARRLVFESAAETTAAMAKAMLTESLSTWLGHRVVVEDLDVKPSDSKIEIDLRYRIAGTEDSRRLRFERRGG